MLQIFYRVLLLLTITSTTNAQPANINDSIMSIKGKWSRSADFYPTPSAEKPKARFPILTKKVDSIAQFFNQAYPNPLGLEASWYASLDEGTLYKGGPWSYAYRAGFFWYYYNKSYKKIVKGDETGTWAYAFINRVFWLFDETTLSVNVDGQLRSVWKFPVEKGKWKGYTLYEPVTHGPDARAIIITKNNSLPWKPVTQLQYLQSLRQITEKEKIKTTGVYDKMIAEMKKNIEAVKRNPQLDQATKDKVVANLQSTLDKQVSKKDADKQKSEDYWNKELKVIDDYIKNNDAATLSKQAIVHNWRVFKGSFAKITDKYVNRLVYVDPGYFNSLLPSYAPQCIVLYWRWNDNEPGRYFRKQIEDNFPVEKLRAMLIE